MTKLTKDAQVKWTMVDESQMDKNIFRIDIFSKSN